MEICDICFDFIPPDEVEHCEAFIMHKKCAQSCRSNVSFGAHILTKVPMGFVWAENSCFLDALLYAYLVADSEVFKRILHANTKTLDYSKTPHFKCERNSVFAGKGDAYIVGRFREMAGKIQTQLVSYVNEMNDPSQDHPQCRRLRENVALCLRSVLGDDGVYTFFKDVGRITKELLLPIIVKIHPNTTYHQVSFYGEEIYTELRNLIANGKTPNSTADAQKLIATVFSKNNPNGNIRISSLLSDMIAESFQKKIIEHSEGKYFEVNMLHQFFSVIFPVGLSMEYKIRKEQNIVKRDSSIDVKAFLHPDDEDAYDILSLAKNDLIVFSNDIKYPILSKEGVYPTPYDRESSYMVDRPLREKLELAGKEFQLVAVMLHVNENHFTSYVRFRGKWYYYNDMKSHHRTNPFNPRVHKLFDAHTNEDGHVVPVLFFYTSSETAILK